MPRYPLTTSYAWNCTSKQGPSSSSDRCLLACHASSTKV